MFLTLTDGCCATLVNLVFFVFFSFFCCFFFLVAEPFSPGAVVFFKNSCVCVVLVHQTLALAPGLPTFYTL